MDGVGLTERNGPKHTHTLTQTLARIKGAARGRRESGRETKRFLETHHCKERRGRRELEGDEEWKGEGGATE